ncbi:hypothetical protein [Streptomyces sp. NPDC048057]|uniref:phage terminase small subunit n=1 Tax=Streptomyces sp. NPDC048057 TaxID=3155628 RepID=UPI0033C6A8DA
MARNGPSGPAPKRPEERRRRNKSGVEVQVTPQHYRNVAAARDGLDETWHPIAQQLWRSFGNSPQAFYFEPSDWAQLRYVIEAAHASLSRYEDRMSVDSLTSVVQALEDFLTTEATRRRVRVAVEPGPIEWPEPPGHWGDIPSRWFLSLRDSGQSAFYTPTDVAFAVYVAEAMHRHLAPGVRMSGRMLSTVIKACSLLLTTEASRRIARMELTTVESRDIDTQVTALMEKYASAI